MTDTRVALLGASGFVGTAVRAALGVGADVVAVRAPRLSTHSRTPEELRTEALAWPGLAALADQLRGSDVVVNAAGNPDASSLKSDELFGANALLPAVVLAAADRAGVSRFIHVSSAVVQNDKPHLDSSEDLRPFSPYSASKVAGERVLQQTPDGMVVVRYRPPSVHAPGRRVTRKIATIAASPISSVARPGTQPTPQALLPNVAAAVAHLALIDETPPPVVHHPSEGITVESLMVDLGQGRRPRRIPRWFARACVRAAKAAGTVHHPTAANARRIELLWLGQRQSESWLTQQGWQVPVGREGWKSLVSGAGRP